MNQQPDHQDTIQPEPEAEETLIDEPEVLSPRPGEALPIERGGRPRAVYSTYHKWVRVSRLAIGAFIFMSAIALLWLVPWIPRGLDTNDYSPQTGFTVYLLLSVALLGIISLMVQERTRRNRESLMVWSSVYDETTGLHNRTYLFDRLALECERARRNGDVFSVIVLQIRGGSSNPKANRTSAPLSSSALRSVAEVIDGMTHPTDMVALLSQSELAVLANRVDREARHRLRERLGEAVAHKLPELLPADILVDVKAGVATYGTDGTEPSVLVQAARTSTALGVRTRPKAA